MQMDWGTDRITAGVESQERLIPFSSESFVFPSHF